MISMADMLVLVDSVNLLHTNQWGKRYAWTYFWINLSHVFFFENNSFNYELLGTGHFLHSCYCAQS